MIKKIIFGGQTWPGIEGYGRELGYSNHDNGKGFIW